MKTTYSELNEGYTFDPTAIVNIISQNPQIGLAIVQLPITLANALIHNHNNLKWSDNPTVPGYYWVRYKNGSGVGINEYSSKDIATIINTGHMNSYEFAGPLEPPQ